MGCRCISMKLSDYLCNADSPTHSLMSDPKRLTRHLALGAWMWAAHVSPVNVSDCRDAD